MTNEDRPLPSQYLARELKRLRQASGLTQAQVGDHVGTPDTTISKIENGERGVPLPHLKLMIQLYKLGPEQAEVLVRLAAEAKEPGWWTAYRTTVPKWFVNYVSLETVASGVWTYESEYVPGLLQTRRYTEALAQGFSSAVHSDNGEGLVAVRTRRQQRLTGEQPLTLRAVINEAALRRTVGGADVMRGQLSWLRQVAEQPNITVQILPFSVGAHPGMTGPFTILRFPESLMNTVFIEIRGDAVYRDKCEDVERHVADFEQLCELALDREGTVRKINEIEEEVL